MMKKVSNLATYIHRWNEYCCYITLSNTPSSLPAVSNRSLTPKSFRCIVYKRESFKKSAVKIYIPGGFMKCIFCEN